MSKRDFSPYRDMLDIPLLKDENPTDYQLLGIDDFEDDPAKIAAAHEKRSQRIAELYQIVTQMSQKIDDARDRISNPAQKEEYDNYLRRTGRAGTPTLGKGGSLAVLFSFVLSIIIVIVSTFYIYPMVVAIPPENIGDSIATLPNYSESETKKEIDILKKRQEDITTMDVNFNLPIDLDADTTVEFVDESGVDLSGEETTFDNQLQEDPPLTLVEPSNEEPSNDEPTLEPTPALDDSVVDPTANETSQPITPDVPEQTEEEPAVPDVTDVPESIEEQTTLPEAPSLPEPIEEQVPAIEDSTVDPLANETPELTVPPVEESVPELTAPEVPELTAPEVPEVSEPVPEPPAVPDVSPVEEPSELTPDVSAGAAALETPINPDVYLDADTPRVPTISKYQNSPIPELPPLEEQASVEPPIAPEPPSIPELSIASEQVSVKDVSQVEAGSAKGGSFGGVTSSTRLSGNVQVDYFIQLGQKARTDADFAQLLFYARQAEDDLMKERAFFKAQQIADVVYESCARCADKTYRSEAFRQQDLVSKRSRLWEYVSAAEAKMASEGTVSPAEANIVARWKIEIENDWQTGLKYLSLSDNEQVRNAAKNEIAANPADVRSILTVANGWWNLSQDPVSMQRNFREHACTWYAKALPFISDKQIRILVEKRISMAESGYPKR